MGFDTFISYLTKSTGGKPAGSGSSTLPGYSITYTQQFDVENRLIQVTPNNTTTKFYYDASGQRTLTEEPNGTLIYTPFPAYEEEIPGAALESLPIQRVTFGLGQPIAIHVTNDPVASNNGTFYLHTDHLGSTSYLTKSTGSKVSGSDARYQPFGPYRTTPSQTITDTGYTGRNHNNSLGLIYYNARYYAPSLARFISPDTIISNPSNPQSFNRYAYVLNSPINRNDPTGHISCDSISLPQDDQFICVSTPAMPHIPNVSNVQDLVDFQGDWYTQDDGLSDNDGEIQAAIYEAVTLMGQALANLINQMHPGWNLTAHQAFLLVFGGPIQFFRSTEKHSYAALTESASKVIIYNLETADGVKEVTNKTHWIIHELGHVFDKLIEGAGTAALALAQQDSSFPNRPSDNKDGYFGFAGNRRQSPRVWQQNPSGDTNEEFADMILGWVFNQWELSEDVPNQWSPAGYLRAYFMDVKMRSWLDMIINSRR